MAGTRPQHPLTDSQLDRELESALGVEPSPEFLARVRTRVAAEPEGWSWRLAIRRRAVEPVTALAIVGIVVTLVVPELMRDGDPKGLFTRNTTRAVGPEPAAATEVGPVSLPRGVSGRAMVARPTLRPVQAEVIVSQDEQQALQVLLRVAYEGRMPALPKAVPDQGVDVPEITIAPVVIDQLPQIARLETEGEGRW